MVYNHPPGEGKHSGASSKKPITFGKLIRYLKMGLMDQFWNYVDDLMPRNQEADPCPYNFEAFMMNKRFKLIKKYFVFMDNNLSEFVDKF